MPPHRRGVALEIVGEVLEAKDADDFYWFMTPGTDEVASYWDDSSINQLWITAGDVHVHPSTELPDRARTYSKGDGVYVGWLLPGAEAGTGGGRPKTQVKTALCPETGITQPAGSICPDCDVVHE